MSLPRELLDDLLSGYMDGELSADENARVEQMLANDPAVRQQLRTLQEHAEEVRAAIGSAPHLDDAFADRVLAATFLEADRSGLAADHPVRLAAAEPHHSHRRIRRLRWSAVGGLAIAASLTAAVVLWRDGGMPDGGGQPPRIATAAPAGDDLAPAVDKSAENETRPQLAEGTADRSTLEIASVEVRSDVPGDVDPTGDTQHAVEVAEGRSDETVDAPRVAATEPATVDESATLPGVGGQSALRAVLVYQVQVTSLGRERGVINRALREADIRLANQREVDDALVGYLESSNLIGDETGEPAGDGPQVSVLFLEGAGTQLEKLMLSLLSAGEEVRSVGFALAMDPPVMAAIDTLEQIDPTSIRGEADGAVAHSLIPAHGEEGAAAFAPAFPAGNRDFMPLRRNSLAGMSSLSGPAGNAPNDITARTLMIIRFE